MCVFVYVFMRGACVYVCVCVLPSQVRTARSFPCDGRALWHFSQSGYESREQLATARRADGYCKSGVRKYALEKVSEIRAARLQALGVLKAKDRRDTPRARGQCLAR